MAIRSVMMILGVTAMFWCALDASTLENCASAIPVVKMTEFKISGDGNIPVAGGDRTLSGKLYIHIDPGLQSQIKDVSVRISSAILRDIPHYQDQDVCKLNHESLISQLCSTSGITVPCTKFSEFFAMKPNPLCDGSGYFQSASNPVGFEIKESLPNAFDALDIPKLLRPLIERMSIHATANIEAHLNAGDTRVGCIRVHIRVTN